MVLVNHCKEDIALTFSLLDPKEALVAAFEQGRGNFSTWTYRPADEYPIQEDAVAFRLGSWVVAKNSGCEVETRVREVCHAQPSLF
ncbi:hypothetical protein GSUB_16820 (plasmid) [Geoalkalibacter subterraneus]|uniref:Uncharacterized protein n=2 Tax=Geoalkalibacter subterraneus TaxID=483547 RepID=A0A0B5FU15_9BACT|nr:hypothetical protein GSUB_16820 [Geoalkalibacter subterraneus]